MNKSLIFISVLTLGSILFLLVPQTVVALTIPDVSTNPLTPTVGRLGRTFEVNVTITNVTNLYGYEFKLSYNTTLLDVIDVKNGTFFPLPPASIVVKMEANDTIGVVWVAVSLLNPEQPRNGSGVLARITFNSTYAVQYPQSLDCPLHFFDGVFCDKNANLISVNFVDGLYRFVPLRGDINGDGVVDMRDIGIACAAFGSNFGDPNWDNAVDLNSDGKIDMRDIVMVCSEFGNAG